MPVTVHFHKGTTQLPRKMQKPGQLVISNGKSETQTVDMHNIYEVSIVASLSFTIRSRCSNVCVKSCRSVSTTRWRHRDTDAVTSTCRCRNRTPTVPAARRPSVATAALRM